MKRLGHTYVGRVSMNKQMKKKERYINLFLRGKSSKVAGELNKKLNYFLKKNKK